MNNKRKFSEWLQLQMERRCLTQAALERAASINRSIVNKIMYGHCNPSLPTLFALAHALKLPIETVYRAANLLPADQAADEAVEEVIHIFNSLQSPLRKQIAIDLVRALLTEEENELQANKGAKRRKRT